MLTQVVVGATSISSGRPRSFTSSPSRKRASVRPSSRVTLRMSRSRVSRTSRVAPAGLWRRRLAGAEPGGARRVVEAQAGAAGELPAAEVDREIERQMLDRDLLGMGEGVRVL